MFNVIRNIEKVLYKKIKIKYDSLSDKNKLVAGLIPKVVVYMIVLIYLSGFIKIVSDYIWFSVIAIFLGAMVFFTKII